MRRLRLTHFLFSFCRAVGKNRESDFEKKDGDEAAITAATEKERKHDMKKGLLFTLICIVCLFTFAMSASAVDVEINDTNFPDASFREYVITNFDTDNNGTLTEAELAAVTEINVSGTNLEEGNIQSLTGIEYFTELRTLKCNYNLLTSLDLHNNTALTVLECYFNKLTVLDVSHNTQLTHLNCGYNDLSYLDVGNNIKLKEVNCVGTQLTSFDISNHTALEFLNCSANANLTALNVRGCTALKYLYCHQNRLISLNLSENTALESLWCFENQLTSLDLGKNLSTISLSCNKNKYGITTVNNTFDLSMLPAGFDVTKASNWVGGTVNGNILTVNNGETEITYTYDCGNSKSVTFTIAVTLNVVTTGDVNEDATVNTVDVVYLIRHVALSSRFPLPEYISADYTHDGVVSIADVAYLIRHIALPSRFPIT